jgi:hypothetical protein
MIVKISHTFLKYLQVIYNVLKVLCNDFSKIMFIISGEFAVPSGLQNSRTGK